MSKKQFKAESKRLLELMINSIYTHKEIFLREIISNASDAEDKLCYLSLTDDKVGLSREDFYIQLEINKALRSLTITDNGIGMTKEEMESNLGTIARSGSLKFKNEMEKTENIDIIGQFGVGFYSAFMVASNVTVISRAYGSDEAFCWQSAGADGYTIMPCERDTWGTTVVMRIKDDTEEEQYSQFFSEDEITRLVRKYSDYIRYPVKLEIEQGSYEKDENGEDKFVSKRENTVLNSMIPIWQKSKKDVNTEDYDNFYAEKFGTYDKPALTIPVSAEGVVSFKALLFVPGEVPFDFYSRDFAPGVQLYSSGVLIMDKCADLVPEHFRFIRGVVDTQDISLNISRELLQHNRQLKIISTNIDKKIRSELLKMQDESREDYEKFYGNFGIQLKYGAMNDYGRNKDVLKDLLMFYSSAEKKLVTFKEYLSRMPEEQKSIFYVAGEDASRIDKLPQTEAYKAKGYELLYLTDNIDEMVLQMIGEFEGKKFSSVDDESALSEDEKSHEDTSHDQAMAFVMQTLGDKISKARISRKLVSSPVCMVADGGLSFEMEKYFETLSRKAGEEVLRAKRVLEFNPDHKMLSALEKAIEADPKKAEKLVKVLYYQAVLTAELTIEDPKEYTDLVCDLIF